MILYLRLGAYSLGIKHTWCSYYYLDEAGAAALQIGPLIMEWPTHC
jgi:hypothetical protein